VGFKYFFRALQSSISPPKLYDRINYDPNCNPPWFVPVPQDDVFLLHKLESGPSRQPELTRQQCLDYYRQMVQVREMEMAAREMYGNKNIRGFLHLYVGQVRAGGWDSGVGLGVSGGCGCVWWVWVCLVVCFSEQFRLWVSLKSPPVEVVLVC